MSSWKERNRRLFDEAEETLERILAISYGCLSFWATGCNKFKHVTRLFASSKSGKVRTIF